MQSEATVKPYKKQVAAFPRAAYSIPDFSALFGREQTWGYRMVYEGKVKAIPSDSVRGGMMIPHSEVERLLSKAQTYDDSMAGKAVPKQKGSLTKGRK